MWFGSKQKWSSGSFFKECRVRIFLGGHEKRSLFYFMENTVMKKNLAFTECMNIKQKDRSSHRTGFNKNATMCYVWRGAAEDRGGGS